MSKMSLVHPLIAAALVTALATPGGIGAAQAQHATTHADTHESDQPGTDTWITTKVKAELLTSKDVPGLELKVETVNGVVSLSGEVDSQAEADRAIAAAKGVQGVTRVDSAGIVVKAGGDN